MPNEIVAPPTNFVDMLGGENSSSDEEPADKEPILTSKGKLLPTRQSARIVPFKPLVGSYEFIHAKAIAAKAASQKSKLSLANSVSHTEQN